MAAPQQRQVIQIPIGAGGIDDKTAAEYVDPSSRALAIVNGVFTHDGSVEKRVGCVALPTTSGPISMGTPLRVASRGPEVLATDGQGLYTFAQQAQAWAGRSYVSPCSITRQHLQSSPTPPGVAPWNPYCSYSIAEGAGYRAIASRTAPGPALNNQAPGDIVVDIYNLARDALVIKKKQLTVSTIYAYPTAIILGTTLYVLYSDTGGTIWGRSVSLVGSTFAWSAAVAIVTDGGAWGPQGCVPFEATPYVPSDAGILIFYAQTTGGGAVPRYLRLEALPAFTVSASGTVDAASSGNQIRLPLRPVRLERRSSLVRLGAGDVRHVEPVLMGAVWARLRHHLHVAACEVLDCLPTGDDGGNRVRDGCRVRYLASRSRRRASTSAATAAASPSTGLVGESSLASYKVDGTLEYLHQLPIRDGRLSAVARRRGPHGADLRAARAVAGV